MSRTKTLPRVTHLLAERHEALWLKLTALNSQLATAAARRPQAPVSGQTSTIAEALLRECRPFLVAGDALPMAAPDIGGLATQLGQALAGLEAWQAQNAVWRGELNAFVWLVEGAEPLPVRRLQPRLTPIVPPRQDAAHAARMLEVRAKLARRIDELKRA